MNPDFEFASENFKLSMSAPLAPSFNHSLILSRKKS